MKYLADTSVLARLSVPVVREALAEVAGSIGRSVLTDLELGFSARTSAEWDSISKRLALFDLVEDHGKAAARAREVQRSLAGAGLKGRKIPDLLIAATAELSGLEVLHYDADFDHIASVTGQAARWVAPRGSID